jgi:hypothetical protein
MNTKRFGVTVEAEPLLEVVRQVRTLRDTTTPSFWSDAITLIPAAAGLRVALTDGRGGCLALTVPFVDAGAGLSASAADAVKDRLFKERPRTITVSGGGLEQVLEELLASSSDDVRGARVTIAEGSKEATVTLGWEVRTVAQCAVDLVVACDALPLAARLWRGDLAVALEHLRKAGCVEVEVRVDTSVVVLVGVGGGVMTAVEVGAFTPSPRQWPAFARLTLGALQAIVEGAKGLQLEIGWEEREGGRWSFDGEGMGAELPAADTLLWDGDLSLLTHDDDEAVEMEAAVLTTAVLRAVDGRDLDDDRSPARVVLDAKRRFLHVVRAGAGERDARIVSVNSRVRGGRRTVAAHALVAALAPLEGGSVSLRFDVAGALVLVDTALATDMGAPRSVLVEQ